MSASDLVSGEIKHTATPWFYQENSDAYTHIVRPEHSKGMIVVQLSQDKSGQSEADARFIVRAVNAHDDLLAACERALRHFETIRSEDLDDTPLMACLRRAVSKGLGAR